MKYYIKEEEWQIIFVKLQKIKGVHSKNESSLRRFMEGVYYVMRTGCQWRMLPSEYGHFRSVHARFTRWSKAGTLNELFQHTINEPDMESVMIDSTIVRAHACSSGYKKDSADEECLGRSKGGFSTKIHVAVDALGNPLKFILTAGQRNDITQGENLIKNIEAQTIIADKGYDSNALINEIKKQGATPVIPPRRNRKVQREYDAHTYKERHLVECFIGKIKHFRRVFSRFDKMADTFLGFLNFAGTLIWLR